MRQLESVKEDVLTNVRSGANFLVALILKQDLREHMKTSTKRTYKGNVGIYFIVGFDGFIIEIRYKCRNKAELREFFTWKEGVQKILGRHWPNDIFFHFFSHRLA